MTFELLQVTSLTFRSHMASKSSEAASTKLHSMTDPNVYKLWKIHQCIFWLPSLYTVVGQLLAIETVDKYYLWRDLGFAS